MVTIEFLGPINKKPIEKAVKGEEVGVKLPKVRINDDVYIIKHF